MSVKIRLRRTGGTNDICYRIVATDTRFPRDGRFLENLGTYDPKQKGRNFTVKIDRVDHWVAHGAILSDTVKNLVHKARKPAATA